MKNADLLVGKLFDFFMKIEINRSNFFKAVFRMFENIFINRSYLYKLRSTVEAWLEEYFVT